MLPKDLEVAKDKELEKWITQTFDTLWIERNDTREIDERAIDESMNYYGRIFFRLGVLYREQFLLNEYFKVPKGMKLHAMNMNEDGFVSLNTRIKAEQLFKDLLWRSVQKHKTPLELDK
jgi:hypothetical protein